MLLAAGPSFEFMRFMQILVWIILPVLLSAVALTVFLHYRRKRKEVAVAEDAENSLILAAPEQFNHKIVDGQYVHFDHSGLIREYKKRMFFNHARYAALRKDYALLEARYSLLAGSSGRIAHVKTKNIYMKNQDVQFTDQLPENPTTEKKELTDKLEQLHRSYQRLEEENRFLLEQVTLQTAGDTEKDKVLDKWKEDYKNLRNRVTEQDYMEELLEEKKAQISFLQNQLEQRIKNQHQSEQQRQQALTVMEEEQTARQNFAQQFDTLKAELQQEKEHTDQLQVRLVEKDEQFNDQQQTLLSKSDQVVYLQNILKETKEQNELLNAELADRKDEIESMKQLLSDEHARLQFMEQKLISNKQLLRRLYNEFSSCIEADNDKAAMVVIRTEDRRNEPFSVAE